VPLLALRNWVNWRWAQIKNKDATSKWTKVPYQPDGHKAKNNDPATWSSYDEVIAAVAGFDGIGFCILNSKMGAFDIDHCRDPITEAIDPWAAQLVERCGSYAEITVSGTGLRIIGYGNGSRLQRKLPVNDKVSLEAYRASERYIVITGNPLPGAKDLANIDGHLDAVVAELDAKKTADQKAQAKANKNGAGGEQGTGPEVGVGDDGEDLLWHTIQHCSVSKGQQSDRVWWVVNEMLRRGYLPEKIVAVLLDHGNGISKHIYEQGNPRQYAEKQVGKAKKEATLAADNNGVVYKTQANIRIALLKLGVTLRYDEFADRVLLSGLPDFGPVLDDAALDRVWLLMDQWFKFVPGKDLVRTIAYDNARLNKFHPVRDYLDGLRWDGVPRIDTWLTTYAGVEDTEYTRAVGALWLVAGVRRVRSPGCKFDEMLILEHEVQGTDKSTALAILAVRDDWFTDDLPLHIEGKQVIETLRGRWIIEAGELSGMKRADIAHLKALLSRQTDRARLSYDRIPSEVPRQCVIAGTTNKHEYLLDTTGNRRYWPVRCKGFNIEALRRDRDQLWAEAATREATGASIRLKPELWPKAAEQQAQRLTQDPWLEELREELGDFKGKISMGTIWTILNVPNAHKTQVQSVRASDAMRALGWKRANTGGTVKINGRLVSGFVKGDKPWRTVTATRSKEGGLHVSEETGFEFGVEE
jgi:predicted P-loop ATPase